LKLELKKSLGVLGSSVEKVGFVYIDKNTILSPVVNKRKISV
jgi:hypothetical protein